MNAPVLTPAGFEPAFDLRAYYPLLMHGGIVLALAVSMLAATQLFPLKPRKPTRAKLMTYESGMDTVGSARMQFDIKFYLIAILFLVFDVELLLLYPWAVIAYEPGAWQNAFGLMVFIGVLLFLALFIISDAYAWVKGVFRWR